MSLRTQLKVMLAGLCVTGALVMPSQAGASQASITVNTLLYLSAAGETNDLTVEKTPTAFVLTDPGAVIVPSGTCTALTANSVTCPAAVVTKLDLRMGDLNDKAKIGDSVKDIENDFGEGIFIQGEAGNDTLTGGKFVVNTLYGHTDLFDGLGDDTLTGGDQLDDLFGGGGQDVLNGGPGRDNLEGDSGNDVVNGGTGDDQIDEGLAANGADILSGGSGIDQISYASRRVAVNISLDGQANDGEAGEGDNVSPEFSLVTGGSGNDTITGSANGGIYSGEDGNDIISGGVGNDQVEGRDGNDTLKGEGGSDVINGGEDSDLLDGGAGDDSIIDGEESGNAGPDQFFGGTGIDQLAYDSEAPLSIDLDGEADDGRSGENDNAGTDLEDLSGSPQADVLVGNGQVNQIEGGGGNDRIEGRGGSDGLFGEAGGDQIDGGEGVDEIDGADGSDSLRSRDAGLDEVDCGSGADTLLANPGDEFTVACDSPSTGARITGSAVNLKKGKGGLKVVCPAVEGTDCAVKITAGKGRKVLVKGAGKVKSGKTGTVAVKLTKAGKGTRGRLKLEVNVVFTDTTGARVTTVSRVAFRR